MQEKTAFDHKRSAPLHMLLSSTCLWIIFPAGKNLTTAHSPECKNKNLEAQQELQCMSPMSTDNQHSVVHLSLQHLPCVTLSAFATSHTIPQKPILDTNALAGSRAICPLSTPLAPAAAHTFMTAAICFHCSGVGSVPVGLCAQAWRMKMENSGAF